jgi:thioredoxin 1
MEPITEQQFNEIIKGDTPVLVDFFADWCAPCRALGPAIARLAEEYEGVVNVVKLDIETAQGASQSAKIEKLPTLVLYKGGVEVDRKVGLVTEPALREMLNAVK